MLLKRRIAKSLTVAFLAALAVLSLAPTVSADLGDSATGSGTASFGTFSFTATGTAGHLATGTMSVVYPGGHETGSVDCLMVLGGDAIILGTVTSATITESIGQQMRFFAEDRATPGAGVDRLTWGGGIHVSCTDEDLPLDQPADRTIVTGEISVIDGPEVDADDDGVADTADNCPAFYNPGQEDADDDGLGDACDPLIDTDDDGVADSEDNCPTVANPGQADVDNDGLGDACDPVDDRTAAEQLDDLIAQLQSAPTGPGNSYLAKLQAIADSIGTGDSGAACNKLNAFENEVKAQIGKKLTQAEADALLAESAAIKTKAGCP